MAEKKDIWAQFDKYKDEYSEEPPTKEPIRKPKKPRRRRRGLFGQALERMAGRGEQLDAAVERAKKKGK